MTMGTPGRQRPAAGRETSGAGSARRGGHGLRTAVLAATVSAVAAAGTALLLQGPTAPAGTTIRLSGTAMVAIPPTPHPTPRGGPASPADPTPVAAPPGAGP